MKTKDGSFPDKYFVKTWVVGAKHNVPNVYKESKVSIKREKNNHHDDNAIAVVDDKGECCYRRIYDDEVKVCLNLPRNKEEFGRLEAHSGAAVFVDGKFVRLELFSCDEMLRSAFSFERSFPPQRGEYMGRSQMFSVIERLIKKSQVTDVEVVKKGPVS